jgi:beta-phosphoglucomutase
MAKAFIFDMDDVVADTTEVHTKAWDLVLHKYGVAIGDMKTGDVGKLFGLRIREIAQELVKHFRLEADPKELESERADVFLGLISKQHKPSKGLMGLLDMLKSSGFRIALATSGVREYAELVIEKLGLKGRFDAVVTGDEVKNGKPDPEPFLKAADRLGVEPKDCIVIEDAEKGIEAAHAAGMKAIGYQNLSHPFVQDLKKADLVVRSLTEITENAIEQL